MGLLLVFVEYQQQLCLIWYKINFFTPIYCVILVVKALFNKFLFVVGAFFCG